MKKLTTVLAVAGLICATSGIALASDTATQTVTYEVVAINELSVSGNPALTVNAATAGSPLTQATDATTTYAITTNQTRKITGALDTIMPAGLTLKANLTEPSTGISADAVTLTDVATDLVTAIGPVAESDLGIAFSLDATVAAGPVVSASKTLTLTIAAP
jgi:hypothetical protein